MTSTPTSINAGSLESRLRDHVYDVVCVGLSAWDQTWEVQALPASGGKTRAQAYRDGGGGMAANAAVAVARLGGRAHFWGRAGNDRAGQAMRDELSARGVDVRAMRLFDGGHSSVSGIVVDASGERSIYNFRGAGLPDVPDWLPVEQAALADAVLVDPRWPEGALAALKAARAASVPTVLDGDVAERDVFETLLPWVDAAVFSEQGLADFSRGEASCHGDGDSDSDEESRLRYALEHGCHMAAVTLGERGVLWCGGGPLLHQPGFKVDALDTTGAGDVFHGAFALALAARAAIPDAMRFAAAVAAIKCRARGGRSGIPDLATVLAMLQTI